jgi:pimeloyl-ACP methyl ester carboxylesterase
VTSIAPPSLKLSLLEMPRAMTEVSLMLTGSRFVQDAPRGDGRAVLVVPGYMADDIAMYPLRWFLNRIGYNALPWKLGRNIESLGSRLHRIEDAAEFRRQMEARLLQRVDDIVESHGEPLSIVGWSMGGLYANTVALNRPDKIRQVITLGTPYGDPRGTIMWSLLRLINRSSVREHEQDFSSWAQHDNHPDRRVPTTVIYSKSDGVVAPESAMLDEHPFVEHITVPSSHMGFAYNPLVWQAIAKTLHKPAANAS